MKRHLIKISAIIVILALVLLMFPAQTVQAGEYENETDVMTRLKASTLSSHDITFDLSSGTILDDDETITVDFGEDSSYFLVDGASSVIADFDFNDGTERVICDVVVGVPDCAAVACDDANTDDIAVGIDDTTGIVTFKACGPAFAEGGAAATINIEYGTVAGGTNRVTNPTAQDDVPIYLAGTVGDTGSLAISILSDDQVSVTATVDSTFTFTISSTTCALGTLSTASVSTCNYNVTTTTNAEDGYTTTIADDGNLRDGTPDINDVGDGTVNAGSEEYGASTNESDSVDIVPTSGDNASAITTTAQSVATEASGPVSSDAVTVTHHASVSTSTIAGSYSHIITLVSTGTF